MMVEYVQKIHMQLFENLLPKTPFNAKQLVHFVKSHDVVMGGAEGHSRDMKKHFNQNSRVVPIDLLAFE